jgi:glycosyltransferase involved in cell wall biosynthesis
MRILMVNDMSIESGWGAESHVARLAEALRAGGDTVDVFAGEVEHHGAARALDVWDPFARRALRTRAATFQPDVVHYHNVLRELSVSVLGAPAGVPSVMTVHEHRLLGVPDSPPRGPRGFSKIPLAYFHRRVVRRHIDLVLGVSKHMTAELSAAGFPAVAHLPQFAASPPADVELVSVAQTSDVAVASRLTPEKGIRELTEAYLEVADRHPQSRLVVAGEGPDEAAVLAAQRHLGPERVRILGRVSLDAVQSLFAGSRVVVVPSVYREGAPTTPIEAALVGRPVIVTDEPGLREFVDESGGGIVVARRSVPELAAALDHVLADGAFAQRLGDAGRAYALEHRTIGAVVPTMRSLYEQAIEQHRPSASRL